LSDPGRGQCHSYAFDGGLSDLELLDAQGSEGAQKLREQLMDYVVQESWQQVGIKTLGQWIFLERGVGASEYTESMRPSTAWGGFMEIAVFCLFYCAQVNVYQDLGGSFNEVYQFGNGHNGRTIRLNYNGSHYKLVRP
jgi:hypothetical protein